jgi:hypothetical protein
VSSPTSVVIDDPHRTFIQVFKQGFYLGRECGRADAQALVDVAQMEADYWYYVANNPGAVEAERRQHVSYLELAEARAETLQRQRWWDELDHQRLDEARGMLADHDDLTIAVTLGLFLPMVSNLRAGVL